MSKPIRIGFCSIRDEEFCIRGWVKYIQSFCNHVVTLIDPQTSDNTINILKSEFPEVEIRYQDRTLGDSDYVHEGPRRSFIMHNNITKFVHDEIKDDEWFMVSGCDERFAPNQIQTLHDEIKFADKHQFGCLAHERLYEVIPIGINNITRQPNSVYNMNSIFDPTLPDLFHFVIDFHDFTLRHTRFDRKTSYWEHKPQPHQGYAERYNPMISTVPLWHFHRIKHGKMVPTNWSDGLGGLQTMINRYKGKLPIMPMFIPFKDWANSMEYPDIDNIDETILNENLLQKQKCMDRNKKIVKLPPIKKYTRTVEFIENGHLERKSFCSSDIELYTKFINEYNSKEGYKIISDGVIEG